MYWHFGSLYELIFVFKMYLAIYFVWYFCVMGVHGYMYVHAIYF